MHLAEPISSETRLPAAAGSARELVRMALPLVISSGSASLMYVMDRVFLTWYSTDAMAATLPAGMLHWTLVSLALGTTGYVNTFVAQYYGAGEPRRIGAVVWQGIWLSLIAGLALRGFVPLAPGIFEWFGHDLPIRRPETEFFSVLCYGAFPLLLRKYVVLFSQRARQDAGDHVHQRVLPLLNGVLDYVLIFGKLGVPPLGISGAAMATVTAWSAACVMYAVALLRHRQREHYGLLAGWRFDRTLFARLLRFGLPNGIQLFVDIACWTLFVQIVGRAGQRAFGRHQPGVQLELAGLHSDPGRRHRRDDADRPADRRRPAGAGRAHHEPGIFHVAGLHRHFRRDLPVRSAADPVAVCVAESTSDLSQLEESVVLLLRYVAVYSLFDAMAVIFSSATRGGDSGSLWSFRSSRVSCSWFCHVGSLVLRLSRPDDSLDRGNRVHRRAWAGLSLAIPSGRPGNRCG